VRSLAFQTFLIPTGSMEETLQVGDRIVVNRLVYRFGEVQRGDVVVFDGSGLFAERVTPAQSWLRAAGRGVAGLFGAETGAHMFVKRVIGLPGERVTCCDAAGRVTVDGVTLDETYVHPGDAPSIQRFDIVVPPGRVWLMGDHRQASADSRSHLGDPGGGTVPIRRIVGRADAVYWPLSRAGRLPGTPPFEHSKESP
jgi:signal peptidase I